MAQRRNRQGRFEQKPLHQMTQKELLKIFFKEGGFMVISGFAFPKPPLHETVYFSLNRLWATKGGKRLLRKTLAAFNKGEIDQNGRPVKPVKVTRRKAPKNSKGGKK